MEKANELKSEDRKSIDSPEEAISKNTEDIASASINYNEENIDAKWIDNQGNEVKEVFGFNENAELVNARAAMFGFLMLILTELVFKGEAATKSIFGIG